MSAVEFSCVASANAVASACLLRDWRAVKFEVGWAMKNGATIAAARLDNNDVQITVALGNAEAGNTITDLDPREADQIIESLRACGVTIKEAVAA